MTESRPVVLRTVAELGKAAQEAFAAYFADVRGGAFPKDDESFE